MGHQETTSGQVVAHIGAHITNMQHVAVEYECDCLKLSKQSDGNTVK